MLPLYLRSCTDEASGVPGTALAPEHAAPRVGLWTAESENGGTLHQTDGATICEYTSFSSILQIVATPLATLHMHERIQCCVLLCVRASLNSSVPGILNLNVILLVAVNVTHGSLCLIQDSKLFIISSEKLKRG